MEEGEKDGNAEMSTSTSAVYVPIVTGQDRTACSGKRSLATGTARRWRTKKTGATKYTNSTKKKKGASVRETTATDAAGQGTSGSGGTVRGSCPDLVREQLAFSVSFGVEVLTGGGDKIRTAESPLAVGSLRTKVPRQVDDAD